MPDSATEVGRQVEESDWFDHAVRLGLLTYGLVHLMIAWLAVQLAFGERSGKVTSDGALHEFAQQPFGHALLFLIAGGMLLLVLWRLLEALVGHRDCDGVERLRKRAASAAKLVVLGVLGVSAFKIALGEGGSGKSGSATLTARLMDLPFGIWLVGLVGVAILGYAGGLIWKGLSEKHAEQLASEGRRGEAGSAYLLLGKVGYVAKGVAFALVGALFCYAAATHHPQRSGGLDAALGQLVEQPFGPILLTVIGIGIGCYGLFSFARARHLSR